MPKSLKDEIKILERKLQDNQDSLFFARLADSYMQSGQLDDAIELCERGVRIHPQYVTGHFILGKCYVRKKLFDQAEKELKRVIDFDGKYIAAQHEFAELMAQIGWNTKGEQAFEEILRIDPLNEKARQRLAELKKQFSTSTIKSKPPEPATQVKPELKAENIFSDSPLSFEKSGFDFPPAKEPVDKIGLKEPDFSQQPLPEAGPKISDEETSIDLLEDIFGDNSITDLETELRQSMAEKDELPSPADDELQLSSADFSMDKQVDQPEPEPDPFHILQQEREKDAFPDDIFGLPSESEPAVSGKKSPVWRPEPDSFAAPESIPPVADDFKLNKEKAADKKEKIVTPTLGEIYTAQHQYSKAISVYELLLKKDADNQFYKDKIKMLQQKIAEEGKG